MDSPRLGFSLDASLEIYITCSAAVFSSFSFWEATDALHTLYITWKLSLLHAIMSCGFGFMTWTISGLSCLWSVSWIILLLSWSISLAYDLCCQDFSCHLDAAEHLMTDFYQAHSWLLLLHLQQLCNIVELHHNIFIWISYLHHCTIDCSPIFFVWLACALVLLYV